MLLNKNIFIFIKLHASSFYCSKEPNPVLRLFGLFRKMHYYLNDVLPLNAFEDDAEARAGKMQTDVQTKCSMPCTMNVQYQVKQAARKCTIFLCDMQQILNANKIYSMELYMECEQSLNKLRNLLTQFETFKRIEMEHKRGQFVTEEARSKYSSAYLNHHVLYILL